MSCFHLVVTPLVSINQTWWVFHHRVCVVEHLVHVLWCCCVSSLSSPRLMMWPVLVRRGSCFFEFLRDGIIRICPSESFESTMIYCAWFVSEMRLWVKAVPLAPVSSNTCFISIQAQSSVEYSARVHKTTLLQQAMCLTHVSQSTIVEMLPVGQSKGKNR